VVYFGVTAYNIAKFHQKKQWKSKINKIGGHERDSDGFIKGVFMYPQKH
jgi:hypothetical protein